MKHTLLPIPNAGRLSILPGEKEESGSCEPPNRWLKAHTGHFSVFLTTCEKMLSSSLLRPIVNWLNPRKHTWNGILLFGIFIGVVLALAEAIGEGGLGPHQMNRFAALATAFVGLEGSGVLVGYAFLAKPLGLFRHDSDDKMSRRASQKKK